eukprot:2363043-Rhodomonas_salina.6
MSMLTWARVHTSTQAHMCACTHAHTQAHMRTCTHAHTHTVCAELNVGVQLQYCCLRAQYEMSGTDIAYAPMAVVGFPEPYLGCHFR